MEERGSSKLILRRYPGCKAHFSQVSNYVRGSLSRCSTKSLVARELFFSVPRCKMATIGLGSSHNCFCAGDLMFALSPCWFVWLSRNNLSGFGFSVVAYITIFITGRKNGFAQSRKKIWTKLVNATFACLFTLPWLLLSLPHIYSSIFYTFGTYLICKEMVDVFCSPLNLSFDRGSQWG